jgi:Bacterial regulatory proteins, tetR family
MARALAKKPETSTTLLEAAKKVLRQNGYAGLSTREVATVAGGPLSHPLSLRFQAGDDAGDGPSFPTSTGTSPPAADGAARAARLL